VFFDDDDDDDDDDNNNNNIPAHLHYYSAFQRRAFA